MLSAKVEELKKTMFSSVWLLWQFKTGVNANKKKLLNIAEQKSTYTCNNTYLNSLQ